MMIQLIATEWAVSRSQSVILKTGRGQRRKHLPYAFTEQDVAVLSSVLNSKYAIAIAIEDFTFRFTAAEWAVLRSRIVIPTSSRGGRRFARDLPPNCFPWRADRCRRDPSVTQSKPPVRRGQQPERPDHQKLQVLEERRPLALNRMANELPDPGDHKYRD
jgi:hypothetical protein